MEIEIVGPLESSIDIDPDTLNLKSKGKWITAYITLSKGYDVNDIEFDSVLLEDRIPAAWGGIQDDVFMVKFDRLEVEEMVSPGQVTLTVSGHLKNGIPFSGSDAIIVINPQEGKNK